MSTRICKIALLSAALAACTGGCAPPQPVALELDGVAPAVTYDDLAFVLDKAVTDDGLLLPELLCRHIERLDAQLARLAVTGPTATPELFVGEEDELAYWYNARAAWSMKLAALCDCPKEMARCELTNRSFPLDGRSMTLSAIDELLAARDDWRVLVSSPGVTLIRNRLPERPYGPEDIHERIAEGISALVDDPRRFEVDIAQRRIRVPPVLWQYRRRLIAEHNRVYGARGANLTTALLPYVTGSAHRRLQDAVGYHATPARPSLLTAVLER